MSRKILIVDDELPFRELAAMLFEDHGFTTVQADNGEDVLGLVKAGRPDLVLLDLMLPGIDGFAVLQTLKNDPSTSKTPVVICSTTFREHSRILKAMSLGASDYICKPLPPEELVRRVVKVLDGK